MYLYLLVNIDPKYTNLFSKVLYVYVHTGAVELHAFRRRPDPNGTDKTDPFLQMIEAGWLLNL